MTYSPPKDIWEVDRQIRFNEPLEYDDPRYVNTEAGRGDFNLHPLLRTLGVDATFTLRSEPEKVYALFCGHRGCGKSTELRRLHTRLDHAELFFVIFLDVAVDLDPNNLRYADVLLALAQAVFKKLQDNHLKVDQVFLTNLEIWFSERIERNEKTKEFATEVKTGAKAEGGLPFLASLFGEITNAFKVNSTYKEELRKVIQNSFSQFADAFNQFIGAVEDQIQKANKGKKLLFVVDGTDRLTGEDSKHFFIQDVHQLQLIDSNFVYCAPIHLLYEGNQVQQFFTTHPVLPMIKLTEREDYSQRFEPGYQVLREMLLQRADRSLFDDDATIDTIIEYSGGNPRELLRILHLAFQRTETDRFDQEAVEKAINDLATDYKRILEAGDYKILRAIDDKSTDSDNNERVRFLLYNLALLEYNGYWRRSHPAVRRLESYQIIATG